MQRSALLTDARGGGEPLGWSRLTALDARTDPTQILVISESE